MRRTTICRSDVSVLTAVLLAVMTGSATAQRAPTMIQRPIDQANRAAAQSNAQTQAQQQAQDQQPVTQAPQGQTQTPATPARRVEITQGGAQGPVQGTALPASHTVAQGETLWALAQQYLGDPLLWPEIYRMNTDVVEDPHWIYPGEELRLAAAEPAAAAAEPEAPAQPAPGVTVEQTYAAPAATDSTPQQQYASAGGRTIFYPSQAAPPERDNIELRERMAYRAVRAGEYYSSGFLTENQRLNTGRVAANAETRYLGEIVQGQSAIFMQDVVVDEPSGDTLVAGDLLLTFERGEEIPDYGQVISPTGLLRVVGPMGNRYRATVIEQYDQVKSNQEFIKVAPFTFNSNRRSVPVTDGLHGRILALRTERVMAVLQTVLFVDKGADDGVRPGDVFDIYSVFEDEQRGGTIERHQASALIVSVRSRSSTAIIIELQRGDIQAGSFARQIRRMPS